MLPGTRSTIKALADYPQSAEVSGVWAIAVLRSFFHRVTQAQDIVDIQIAAGAALQDLDELQGIAEYEEPAP